MQIYTWKNISSRCIGHPILYASWMGPTLFEEKLEPNAPNFAAGAFRDECAVLLHWTCPMMTNMLLQVYNYRIIEYNRSEVPPIR